MGNIFRKCLSFARIVFSLILLGAVFAQVNWSVIAEVYTKADLSLLAIPFLLYLVTVFLQGVRWHIFLKSDNGQWLFWKVQFVNFIAFFHDLYIPGKVGSDAYRLIFFRKEKNVHHVVASLLCLRLQGLAISAISAGLAFLLLLDLHTWRIASVCLFIILILVGGIVARKAVCHWIANSIQVGTGPAGGAIKDHIFKAATTIEQVLQKPISFAASFLVGFIFILFVVLIYFSCGIAFHLSLPFGTYLLSVPILILVSVLPVTLHGRGITELLAIYFWQGPSAGKEQIVLTCLAVYLLIVFQGLMSGLFWVVLRSTNWFRRL